MALKTTPIAQQARGAVSLLIVAGLLALFYWGWLSALPFGLLVLALMFVYRDPPRKVPASPLGIIAPVDGVIVAVESTTDTLLERQSQRVTIKIPLLGPYMVRSPTEGKVMRYWAKVGGRSFAQWVQTDEQDDVLLLIQPRAFGGSLRFRVAAGERIGQGAHCGSSRFARQAQLYLPANSVIDVKKGDTVLAGEDILATLVRSS